MKHVTANKSFSRRTKLRLGGGSAIGGAVLALTSPATAQCVVDAAGICTITNSAADAQITATGPTVVVNSGTGAAITQTAPGYLFVTNNAGASIDGLTLANPVPGPVVSGAALTGVTILNAGAIDGDVLFGTGGIYVNDGGTVSGNVAAANVNNFTTETFINRSSDDTGVGGIIDPGNGVDVFIQSFAQDATYALPTARPAHFEFGGIEALGTGTTVTVTNMVDGVANDGLIIWGDGNVVNRATLNDLSFVGSNIPPQFFPATRAVGYAGVVGDGGSINFINPVTAQVQGINYGGALASFVNESTINGDIFVRTAVFSNAGDINLRSNQAGTLILTAADEDFSFSNSGVVTMTDNGARPFSITQSAIALATAPNSTVVKAVTLDNSGEIGGGLSFNGLASDFSFTNSGMIDMGGNPNGIDRAVEITLGQYDFALSPDLQGDVAADSVTITNSGTGVLNGGLYFSGVTKALSFVNHGQIMQDADDAEAEALQIEVTGADVAGTDEEIDAQSVSVVNTGTIGGTVELGEMEATSVTFDNSGTIARTATPANVFAQGYAGVEIEQETTLGSTMTFTNSGAISTADYAGTAVSLSAEAGDVGSGNPAAQTANAAISVVNSGTILASGGAYITPGQIVGLPANQNLIDFSAGLVVGADAEGASSVSITNTETGIISARGAPNVGLPGGPMAIANAPANAGGIAIAARGDTVTIVNDGTILGGPGGSLTLNGITNIPVVDQDVDFQNVVGGAIDTFDSVDTITNGETGVIEGSIALRDGDDVLSNYGTITGNINFGAGDDRFIQGVRATLTGIADGGAGNNTALIDITGGGTIDDAFYTQLVNFQTVGVTGTGVVTSNQQQNVEGDFALEEGSVVNRPGETAISGSATQGNNVDNMGTVIGDVALGGGDNSLNNGGSITGNVTTGSGSDQLANSGTIIGDVDLGDGEDHFSNTGTITGNVNLAGGADSVDGAAIGSIDGIIYGGDDDSIDSVDLNLAPPVQVAVARSFATLAAVADPATVLDLSLFEHLDGFEQVTVNGPGTVEASGDLPVETIVLNGATLHVASGASLGTQGATVITGGAGAENVVVDGAISGGIALGDGADSVEASGSIAGPVDLGAGADSFVLTGGASFGSSVSGGAGVDVVTLATNGTASDYAELDLSAFRDFEGMENSSGTAALSGTADVGAITVSGGRLIGRAGSSIIGDVQVGNGATFGSAGSVTGNVSVASGGTLSPGASPGTMTINGDLSLATGTTTLFEMTPTVTDQIIINGSLVIAAGATLSLTGDRPLMPGTALDLIVASDGITGSYSTITLEPTVFGFVSQTADRIQLMGQFGIAAATSTQTAATIDYVNAVLVGQQGSAALLAAIPSLITSTGIADSAAFAQLNPEAYASASQMGIENGLSLAKATRGGAIASVREQAGLYSFAQGLGDTRKLSGNADTGVSRSSIHSYGVLGGIGFGSKEGSIGAFIGYLDGRQKIAGLGARTDADGIVAGVAGRLETEGFDLTALFAYDGGDAKTRRALPGAATATSSYKLRSWVWDISAGYSIPAGAGWAVRPEAGITHVSTRRGAAVETGSPAFALAVESEKSEATFVDGALMVRGGQDEGARVHPWLSGGVRHQITGGASQATGGFVGTTTRFTVVGAARKQTLATAGAGLSVDLSPGISLFAAYQGEFGKGGEGHNGNVGLRIGF